MLRLPGILSLDVAVGAALMSWLLSRFWLVELPFAYYVELSLVVWLIYTADHLLDARNISGSAASARHRFHQKHYRKIMAAAVFATVLFFFNIPISVNREIWLFSSFLFFLIVLYFFSLLWARKAGYRYVLKEVFVALCYTAGVALAPLSYGWKQLGPGDFIILIRVFALALGNLLLFSLVDYPNDRQDGHPSAADIFGTQGLRRIVFFLLLAGFLLGTIRYFSVASSQWPVLLTMSAMELALLLVFLFRKNLVKNDRYRLLGDGIFLFPLILCCYELFQRL
jgi:hypothetical protein